MQRGAIVSNDNGNWQYSGGGKWNEYIPIPEGYNKHTKRSKYTGEIWPGYNKRDIEVRNTVFSTDNPIKRAIQSKEKRGVAEPLTVSGAERYYGGTNQVRFVSWTKYMGSAIELGAGSFIIPGLPTKAPSKLSIPKRGSNKWPSNDGFLYGKSSLEMINEGVLLDRFGYEAGVYLSPKGAPFSSRALPNATYKTPYHVYEVVKPFPVESGRIAPGMGHIGYGWQYKSFFRVERLLQKGYIKELPSVKPFKY